MFKKSNELEPNSYCEQCKGTCYDEDQFKRQKNVLEKFGTIPNRCVDEDHPYGCICPYKPRKTDPAEELFKTLNWALFVGQH